MTKKFVNSVHGYGCFSQKQLLEKKGKLLMLDIDFGMNCSLNCPYCFRKQNKVNEIKKGILSFEELLVIISEAKKLGLEQVKVSGAGEPFEEPRFLEFLKELKRMKIKVSIFTKGHVLGDDFLARKYFRKEGINSAKELCKKLKELDVSILLGFNSFSRQVQTYMVGNAKNYTKKRNTALANLLELGFNKKNLTRLALAVVPLTKENYNEAFSLYVFAREMNAIPIITPAMVSGRCSNKEYLKSTDVSDEKKIELYTKIYKYNIEQGLQSLEEIKKEGISCYAGIDPCNQIACGMYLTLNGTVLRCPGDDVTVLGDVHRQSLREIWENSENFKRAGTFNCGCPPKEGKTIPVQLYSEVIKNLEKEFE